MGVYIADLDPAVESEIRKVRPAVVVSRDEMNRFLDTVVICPLTSRLHPRWRGHLQVRCAGQDAEIAVDQIRTISKQRLGRRIDRSPTTTRQDCAASSARCTPSDRGDVAVTNETRPYMEITGEPVEELPNEIETKDGAVGVNGGVH